VTVNEDRKVPLSRGVGSEMERGTKARCGRCGAELGTLAPGQTIRDLPICSCRVLRRPAPTAEAGGEPS
jgi:hypothetical protein